VPAQRLVSLAAGTVLDVDPATAVDVAFAAGFPAVGIWYDAAAWTGDTTRKVAARLDATGVIALDIEPVILGRAFDSGDAIIDTAYSIGARHVLVASGPAERATVVERFGALCALAGKAGITVVLEFLPIFSVASLADALSIVEEVGADNGGVLVDTLHLARSGGTPKDLVAVVKSRLPYLQIADAPAEPSSTSMESLRDEALHGRSLPGEGALPLEDTLAAVPGVPLSLELRSSALMARYPKPVERARAVLTATRALLASVET
jgi:sugar phosphate isomerase/epimerase